MSCSGLPSAREPLANQSKTSQRPQGGRARDVQGDGGTTGSAQPQQEKAKGRAKGIIAVFRFLVGG